VISFDADPRTRLVTCAAALAALSILGAPLLGDWLFGFLLAAPAIIGYFAARMDWPLFAAGIALTPMLGAWLVSSLQPASPDSLEAAGFATFILPAMCVIALASGAIGAWIGSKTHGGDWRRAPISKTNIVSASIWGLVFAVALVSVQSRRCGGPGWEGAAACQQATAIALGAGGLIGALWLRTWAWPAMATTMMVLVMMTWVLIDPPGALAALSLSALAGMISLSGVAWIRFAMEAVLMRRDARAAPAPGEGREV
jgi:hypothetical protein